jgi:hypothetical protein
MNHTTISNNQFFVNDKLNIIQNYLTTYFVIYIIQFFNDVLNILLLCVIDRPNTIDVVHNEFLH